MIKGLNHFNIATTDLEKSVRFYENFGLVRGHRPDFGNTGVWMYYGPNPILHLNLESEVGPIVHGTGVVHHLGFSVRGTMKEIREKLDCMGIDYQLWPVTVVGWHPAIYSKDPNGVTIEFVLVEC